jgi:hypothetical protein
MACRIQIFASLPLLSSENMCTQKDGRRKKGRREACAIAMKSNRTCGCRSSTFSERDAPGEDCNREVGFRV